MHAEVLEHADGDGCVDVVAARVGDARGHRPITDGLRVGDRVGVDVGPDEHEVSRFLPVDACEHTRAADTGDHRVGEGSNRRRDALGGPRLREAQLRVRVQITSERDQRSDRLVGHGVMFHGREE